MSVIIRLQNLPWSANALDVRNFFKGLSIPDGGVHIVGGEMGDAFIAFSTDEDARQAMMLNGGKIKEVQVSLLLSSRAEMQKVIEDARRTTMSFMQLSAQSAPPVVQPPAPVVPKVVTPAVTVATSQPQPPVISLSGFLAQNLSQQKAAAGSLYSEIPGLGFLATGGGMFQPNAPAAGLFSALSAQTYSNAAGTASNAAFTQLSEQLKKVSEAEKNMGLNAKAVTSSTGSTTSTTKKDSGERSSRRSSSRERDRRRSRSRSRDRGSRRRGRDRSRDRRSRSRSRDRRDRRRRSRSRDRRDDRTRDKSRERDQKTADRGSKSRSSRFSDRPEPKPAPVADAVVVPPTIPNLMAPQPTTFANPWDTPIQQSLLKLANTGVDKLKEQSASPPAVGSPKGSPKVAASGWTEQPQNNVAANPIAPSFRMNVLPSVNYGSFQSSKPLSNEQLSKLQELQARRDPIVSSQESKAGSFSDGEGKGSRGGFDSMSRRDGRAHRPNNDGYQTDSGMNNNNRGQGMRERSMYESRDGQSVKLSYMDTSTGYGEVRRFFHGQTISSNGIKMINDQNGRRTGVALVRFLRRDGKKFALTRDGMPLKNAVVKIEAISDAEFEEAIDAYRPGYDDDQSDSWREGSTDRKDRKREEVIEIRDDSFNQDNKSGTVVIWNLPTMATELDLMKIFSDLSVVEVLIIKNYKNPKQLDGYVKFHRWEDARMACDSIHKHYVRNKRVFVKQCSEIEYDAAKNEYEAPQVGSVKDPEPVTVVLDDASHGGVETSKASAKKNEPMDDDKMDLAEDEEDDVEQPKIQQKEEPAVLNQIKINEPPPSNFQPGMGGALNQGLQPRQIDDSPSRLGGNSWDQEQQTPPMNRDPKNMFNQNFSQQQQLPPQHQQMPPQHQQMPPQHQQLPPQYQQLPPQQHQFPPQQQYQQQQWQQQQQQQLPQQPQQQQQQQPATQLNLGFGGGDLSRDPRRRQDAMGQNMFGFDQSNYQGDNSRDSFGSQSRFNPQAPPPLMGANPYGQQQMGPMGGSNRYDQQQQQQQPQQQGGSFGNNRYDQQMGNNYGGPPPSRYDQQMGNNLTTGPMGNNQYQQQQPPPQLPNMQENRYGGNRFDQQQNRNNGGRNNFGGGGNEKTTFIMITNLEYAMKEQRIHEFFDQAGFNPKHIHLIRNQYGRSCGECVVEFGSPQEAGDTLSKNACILGKRKAFIKHLNRNQLDDVMQRINGPGQNSQRGGQFGGNNSFSGNSSFGGNNSSDMGRTNNFGNNDIGNRNNAYGNDNYDNRGSQRNDNNRYSYENRNFGGEYYQGSNMQDDNQPLDDEMFENDAIHDKYEDPDDYKYHDDNVDDEEHGDHDIHEENDGHDNQEEHDDYDDHGEQYDQDGQGEQYDQDGQGEQYDQDGQDEHVDQQNIVEENNVPEPVVDADQHVEDLTGDDEVKEVANEPTSQKAVYQQGPEDDDPPLKQPTFDDDDCEIIEIADQSAEDHDEQQPEEQQEQQQQQPEQPQPQQQEQPLQEEAEPVPEQPEGPSEASNGDAEQGQQEEEERPISPIRGNILCLGNLPFRAQNEELVQYFREYNVTLEDVKRRYLPDGRTTGDAMVRFRSAIVAQQAMQTHQKRRIGGRPIRMRILED